MENKKEEKQLRPAEIAKLAGVSRTIVYRRAKELGRLPTVDEARPRPNGRPRKYN